VCLQQIELEPSFRAEVVQLRPQLSKGPAGVVVVVDDRNRVLPAPLLLNGSLLDLLHGLGQLREQDVSLGDFRRDEKADGDTGRQRCNGGSRHFVRTRRESSEEREKLELPPTFRAYATLYRYKFDTHFLNFASPHGNTNQSWFFYEIVLPWPLTVRCDSAKPCLSRNTLPD